MRFFFKNTVPVKFYDFLKFSRAIEKKVSRPQKKTLGDGIGMWVDCCRPWFYAVVLQFVMVKNIQNWVGHRHRKQVRRAIHPQRGALAELMIYKFAEVRVISNFFLIDFVRVRKLFSPGRKVFQKSLDTQSHSVSLIIALVNDNWGLFLAKSLRGVGFFFTTFYWGLPQ